MQEANEAGPGMETAYNFGQLYKEHVQKRSSVGSQDSQPMLIWGENKDLYNSELLTHKFEMRNNEDSHVEFLEDILLYVENNLRDSGKIKEGEERENNLEARVRRIFDLTSENEFFKYLDRFQGFLKPSKKDRLMLKERMKGLVEQVTNGVITPKEFLDMCRGQDEYRDPGVNIQSLMVGLKGELRVAATTEDVLVLEQGSGDLYVMGTSFLGGSVRSWFGFFFGICLGFDGEYMK